MSAQFTASGLAFQFVDRFTLIWSTTNDHYSSAAGSFWDPVLPDTTWLKLGSVCVGQTNDPSHQVAALLVKLDGDGGSNPPIANPTAFNQVWNDRGTGNTGGNGSCWRMVPPAGYVSLGDAFIRDANYTTPNVAHYACVRADLVQDVAQAGSVWNDQGTGATSSDLQCYRIASLSVPPSDSTPGTSVTAGSWALDAGTFLSRGDYSVPVTPIAAIVLPSMGTPAAGPATSPPKLTPGLNVVPQSNFALAASLPVLFPMIDDSNRQLDWKIANPSYTIEIWGQWSGITTLTTSAGVGSISQEISSGIESTSETSWENELGIEVEVGAEADVGFLGTGGKVSGSLTGSYAHTWSGSVGRISSSETTISVESEVPANMFAVLWQLNYCAYLRRQDGTYVGKLASTGQGKGLPLGISTSNYAVTSQPYPAQ